jgi:hypothetical protein
MARVDNERPPKEGKWHCFTVTSKAEAEEREAAMRASGQMRADNHLFCIILTSPEETDDTGRRYGPK